MNGNLVLYFRPDCTHCVKVLHYMQVNDIKVEAKSIYEGDNQLQLMQIGGKSSVPCLVIDGEVIYGGEDIIDYLAEHLTT
jgi:glutaredoxin